jgi:ArsR family transcriptional regulator
VRNCLRVLDAWTSSKVRFKHAKHLCETHTSACGGSTLGRKWGGPTVSADLLDGPSPPRLYLAMRMKSASSSELVDRMFRAFSDRTRLRILHLLLNGELCVCDLVRVLDLPQPKVSRHLAYLRRAGLVTPRKEGLWMYYKLAPSKTAFHRKIMECLSCCFAEVPELARDSKKLGSPKKDCCG